MLAVFHRHSRDHFVARAQPYADHAARVATHLAHLVQSEPDGLAVLGHQHHFVVLFGGHDLHELVALYEIDGFETFICAVEFREQRPLDPALLRHEKQVRIGFVVSGVYYFGDCFVFGQVEEVDQRDASGFAALTGNLIGFEPESAPQAGEKQQICVSRCVDDLLHIVVLVQLGGSDAHASPALGAELFGQHALGVACGGEHEHHLVVFQQIFHVELAGVFHDFCAARLAEGFSQLGELVYDDLLQLAFVGEDFLKLGYLRLLLFVFF